MNFDKEIAAHCAWKKKLIAYLAKRDGSLNRDEIMCEKKCPLGRWLYGEGIKFVGVPEFSALKREHARFHKAVGDVIRRADSGMPVTEEVALGSKSEFGSASCAVVTAIMNLKQKVD